jgi:arsenical pump membrane protein
VLLSLAPALAFLLAGVPLAWLLDELGFFDAVISTISGPSGRAIPTWTLWFLAALTTVVLNLDTTVVLLTPLALRLARRSGVDPLPIAAIPLLLASLASSVLPVSNLTTLVVAARLHLGVGQVLAHLALPSVAASLAGWAVHRRLLPARLDVDPAPWVDRRALRVGGAIVATLLVGFVVGPSFGVQPWMSALAADLVLMAVVRSVPWRHLPVATAVVVAAVALMADAVVPSGLHLDSGSLQHPAPVAGLVLGGAALANVVNNLPALFVGLAGVHHMSWAMWAWLLGINTGAALLPIGALANILWRRVLRHDGIRVTLRIYASLVTRTALAGLGAATLTLAAERVLS